MRILQKGLNFCTDCMIYAVNNDLSGLDYYLNPEESAERAIEIKEGLANLHGHAVMTGIKNDFSRSRCDCCGYVLHGERFIFNLIGD